MSVPSVLPYPVTPEEVLFPTTTGSIPDAYFIGPYGRRVSFASQQRRAFNVAWALEQAHPPRIKRDDRIAVIGAGLAGLTMTVALAARGMRVSLYEAMPGALTRQSSTNHRFVHPTINFWPEEVLGPTTEFPFFDWAAGIVDDVIGVIRDEWTFIHPKLEDAAFIQRVHTNTAVTKLKPMPDGRVEVECAAKPDAGAPFSAVIVTTGFGNEVIEDHTNTESYWENDYLEDKVRDSDMTDLLVSGTGDGGLVDTLRLLHSKFDLGAFCVELASDLTDALVASDLAVIEQEARTLYDAAYAGAVAGGAERKLAASSAAEAAASLYDTRLRHFLASRMPDAVKKKLDRSLINRRGRNLTLVGRLSRPYSVNAAPIHRLLIAHAIDNRALDYEPGTLAPSATGLTIENASLGDKVVTPDYSIARHGSILPIDKLLLDPLERLDLQVRQEPATAWLTPNLFKKGYFNFSGYPPHNVSNRWFATRRFEAARSYIWKTARGLTQLNDHGAPRFSVTPPPQAPGAAATYESRRVPKRMFGIPVETTARKTFRSSIGRGAR